LCVPVATLKLSTLQGLKFSAEKAGLVYGIRRKTLGTGGGAALAQLLITGTTDEASDVYYVIAAAAPVAMYTRRPAASVIQVINGTTVRCCRCKLNPCGAGSTVRVEPCLKAVGCSSRSCTCNSDF